MCKKWCSYAEINDKKRLQLFDKTKSQSFGTSVAKA